MSCFTVRHTPRRTAEQMSHHPFRAGCDVNDSAHLRPEHATRMSVIWTCGEDSALTPLARSARKNVLPRARLPGLLSGRLVAAHPLSRHRGSMLRVGYRRRVGRCAPGRVLAWRLGFRSGARDRRFLLDLRALLPGPPALVEQQRGVRDTGEGWRSSRPSFSEPRSFGDTLQV